jgi:hypothetical protein
MKTRSLVSILTLLLICAAGAASIPSMISAAENEYYQGHPGQWQQQGKSWQWRSTHGDDWYQGRQGNWYKEQNGWQYQDNDGDEYRQGRNGWQWYDRYGKYHQSYQHGPHHEQ